MKTKGARGEGCAYIPSYKHVRIPMNLQETKCKFLQSEYYRTNIVYHEFGHAKDWQVSWRNSNLWKQLYNKYKTEINKDNGIALEMALKAKANSMGGYSQMSKDDIRKLGAYADVLQSLVNGHRYVWNYGHPVSYWRDDKMLAEFIAHASENYWGGNDLFEELYPELYKDMCDLVYKMK